MKNNEFVFVAAVLAIMSLPFLVGTSAFIYKKYVIERINPVVRLENSIVKQRQDIRRKFLSEVKDDPDFNIFFDKN